MRQPTRSTGAADLGGHTRPPDQPRSKMQTPPAEFSTTGQRHQQPRAVRSNTTVEDAGVATALSGNGGCMMAIKVKKKMAMATRRLATPGHSQCRLT